MIDDYDEDDDGLLPTVGSAYLLPYNNSIIIVHSFFPLHKEILLTYS